MSKKRPRGLDRPDDPENERPKYRAYSTTLLSVTSGNRDNEAGLPIAVLTVLKADDIESQCFSLEHAKELVTGMLVVLATHRSKVARILLDNHFDLSDDGDFSWPADEIAPD